MNINEIRDKNVLASELLPFTESQSHRGAWRIDNIDRHYTGQPQPCFNSHH